MSLDTGQYDSEKFPARTVTFAIDSVVADPTSTIWIIGDILA